MRQDTTSALSGLASFAKLQELLAARSHAGSVEAMMTFETFEVELGKAVRGLENELKAADLARYDVEADALIVDGKAWRKCLEQQPKTSRSASGPLTVARTLYRPADGGKCICPLELCAGIIGGLYTPVLARQVAYLMGHMTSEETSQVFTELGISGPSRSSCDRLPKLLSAVWAGYREVGCGTVSLYDADAQRLDTVRYGRAPEAKKKTLTTQLDAELAAILAVRPDLEVVALADGAEENWRYFDQPVYEYATKIVDHGHASQHLRAAMAAFYGEKSVEGRAEYERLRILLRDQPGGADDVSAVMARLTRKMRGKPNKRRRKLLNAELTYFKNQRNRLDYADYQARGLPIGSGLVEAACKTLATQRLKRSGMSWRDGKQAILTIRSLQQSQRWAAAWALLSAHFRVEVIEVRKYGHLRELTPAKKAA